MLRFLLLLCPIILLGQNIISGEIVDKQTGAYLYGVNIIIKNTSIGTVSDWEGKFTLDATSLPVVIEVSLVGYKKQEVIINSNDYITVAMSEGVYLEEVVIVGSRGKPRTVLNSAVPIDNISVSELEKTNKPIIERMLTFAVPSFNSQNQSISDATAHYDPADLRGLGSSRTLVLINGKRKNQSAQVYLNRTVGKGEVGVDLKSIPHAAIERIEVLRDGASAQYGSDAVAGVINIVLKENYSGGEINSSVGITSEGDGLNQKLNFNKGFIFSDKGFASISLGYYNQQLTNRAGTPGVKDVHEYLQRQQPPLPLRPEWIEWAEKNPDLGMIVGQPDMEIKDVSANIGYPINKNLEFYSTNIYTARTGRSFAYYRAPYWRPDVGDSNFITLSGDFIGYHPTFETIIEDHFNTLGIKLNTPYKTNFDLSFTHGFNKVDYFVNRTVNGTLLEDRGTSPRSFYPGGYDFRNLIGNLDIYIPIIDESIGTSLGFEYKKEFFRANEGDPASYYGTGSDSFAGIMPEQSGIWERSNWSIYLGTDFDITNNLYLGLAGRYENFSDFGSNFSWKTSGRFNFSRNGVIRGSYSTGFRAPSLHQINLDVISYIINPDFPDPQLQGTFPNASPVLKELDVPSLDAEISKNLSFGTTYQFNTNFFISLDFYQIEIDNRILFSSQIRREKKDDIVQTILINNNTESLQFFINAGKTRTIGADMVFNYKNISIGSNVLNLNLLANFNTTEIQAVITPEPLRNAGYNVFAREERGLIINSRPKSKFIIVAEYDANPFSIRLANTLFGKVTITAPEKGGEDQVLAPTLGTDITANYRFSPKLNISFNISNIFDVYPDITKESTMTAQAGNRFLYSSEVQQIGQLGRNFNLGLNYVF